MPKDYLRPANRQQPLLVAIDFGTAYSSVVYYIDTRSPHERAKGLALGKIPLAALKVVGFNRAAQIGTQMAWYDKRQMWLWGHRVDEYIHRKEILESDRIQMAKLYMEHSEITKPIRDRVTAQLEALPEVARMQLGRSKHCWAEGLVSLYLRELWADTKIQIRSSGVVFEDTDIECWMGVPKYTQSYLEDMFYHR